MEPGVPAYPRGMEILARFPGAERIEVPSHWNIPSLHGNEGSVDDWVRIKRDVLVLGRAQVAIRCVKTGGAATLSRRAPRTAARWPAPTATCRAAKGMPTPSAPL